MRLTLIGKLFPLLFDTDDSNGIGDVSDVALGHSGDVEIMGRGDDKVDDDTEDDDKEEKDEEEEEQDEVEVFDEPDEKDESDDKEDKKDEKDEKEEDDDKPFEGRPTLTDIKTKYPKIFKEFPELREVLFREQEFGKHFGTVEEAEEAAAKATNFNVIEAALLGGDASPIIDQLAANAPEALPLVAENILPSLLRVSQDLYLRATVPVVEQFIFTLYESGKTANDANMMRSAQHAANFFFGKPDIPDPSRRKATGPNPAEEQLKRERATWAQERFQEASSEVSGAIDVELEGEILKGLDPDKKMSERQRTKLIQDIKDEIDAQLAKDAAFTRQMRALWKKAGDASYPKEQRASIKSAFLARAKALVPSVRTRLRAEWFGETPNSGKGSGDKNKQGQQSPKKRNIPDSGRASGGRGSRPPAPKEVDYSKTSDEDLINGRFARKR